MYLDTGWHYTPGGNGWWNPSDGADKNIGTTRLFFRKILGGEDYVIVDNSFVGEDYVIVDDSYDIYALRDKERRD